MTIEQIADRIGSLSDTADNYAHAANLPLSPRIHAERLKVGMERLRDELRAVYIAATGKSPWE